jgi:hypothetical protein
VGGRVFQGTIPPEARSMIRALAGGWSTPDIYVGCSGNFTIERSLSDLDVRLHSNDVSIYSCTLGRYLAGQPLGVRLKEEARPLLGWLEDSLDDAAGTVATMFLGTRFFGSVGRDHPYHRRVVAGHRAQWTRMHDATRAKVEAVSLRLASFTAGDVCEWVPQLPAAAPVCSFPPFWGGGYETMWKPLETFLDWPRPDYEVLEEDAIGDLIDAIADRPMWVLGTKARWPSLDPFLRGRIQLTPRSVPMFMYADGGSTRLVAPWQKITPVAAPRLSPGDVVGERITLHPLQPGQFNALRSQYLNPHIAPGAALLPIAVAVDRQLVGVFALDQSTFDRGSAYLMSDFPVAPTSYKHLAKLVVAAAMSREAQLLLQRSTNRLIRQVATTAFSQHPQSMKYRGLLKCTKRTEVKDGPHRWQLQYEGDLGGWSLAEALEMWRARWGARTDQEVSR